MNIKYRNQTFYEGKKSSLRKNPKIIINKEMQFFPKLLITRIVKVLLI